MTPASDAGRAVTSGSAGRPLTLLRRSLLSWYASHSRDLPWRRTSDPYAIWISEVMLQQTTVAAVRPRWESFLRRFPDLAALARAPEQRVLAEWSGLGYYARARNLHRAAREIVRRGGFPRTLEELRRLPGVGPYTASAIASIAFGIPAAVVDGNVARVLCRVFALRVEPRRPAAERRLQGLADGLIPPERPGAFNQALMELGATVCLPRTPRCPACPLRRSCAARKLGTPEAFPARSRRKPTRRLHLVAGLAQRDGKIVLVRDEHVVPGHISLPMFPVGNGQNPADVLRRRWRRLAAREAGAVTAAGRLRHTVLDRRYLVDLFLLRESPASRRGRRQQEERAKRTRAVVLVRPADIPGQVRSSLLDKALALWRASASIAG